MRWDGPGDLPPQPRAPGFWPRAGLRGGAILALLGVGFPLLLLLRLPEAALWGARRPVTPWITQLVCILTCRVLGLRLTVAGQPMAGPGACVSNHVSWLDIFVLNACARVMFVAKSEVRGWAGIGWLARGTATAFIERRRAQAANHHGMIEERLIAGHLLHLFPEGTSTDGRQVLPFRSTLFEAFFTSLAQHGGQVQPVSLTYQAPAGRDPRFYGWWGEMAFGPALLQVLGERRQGAVRVVYHPPLVVADYPDRKALARAAETAVRQGHSALSEAAPAGPATP